MNPAPKWQYNEMKFCGVDFSKVEEVAAYDSMHKKFRDYSKASEEIIRRLSLGSDSTVIDLGSGINFPSNSLFICDFQHRKLNCGRN